MNSVTNANRMNLITLSNIQVIADKRLILDISAAEIDTNHKITALIGPNGSGKTTLLKLIHKLTQADRGAISLAMETALVLHQTPLIKTSVRGNLALLQGTYPHITNEAIDQVLTEFDLAEFSNRIATKLSAGEKQKLCLARAKLLNNPLILLDEPTNNLDPQATEQIENLIFNMAKLGTHFIIATHDIGLVRRITNQVILMSKGSIIEYCSANHLFSSANIHPLAKEFIHRQLGSSPSVT